MVARPRSHSTPDALRDVMYTNRRMSLAPTATQQDGVGINMLNMVGEEDEEDEDEEEEDDDDYVVW